MICKVMKKLKCRKLKIWLAITHNERSLKVKDLPPPLGNADIKSNKMKNSNNDSSKLSMIYSTFAIGDVDANFQAWR